MGFVRVRAKIWNIENPSRYAEVELLADIGAIYTVLPSTLLQTLGIKPIGRKRFRVADNRVIERDIEVIGIEIGDRWTHTIAVFGDENISTRNLV